MMYAVVEKRSLPKSLINWCRSRTLLIAALRVVPLFDKQNHYIQPCCEPSNTFSYCPVIHVTSAAVPTAHTVTNILWSRLVTPAAAQTSAPFPAIRGLCNDTLSLLWVR